MIDITSSPQQMQAYGTYVVKMDTLCTFTLPTDANYGDVYMIIGFGSGGWTVDQNDNQQIQYAGSVSTTGTSGSISSNVFTDTLTLCCTTEDGNTFSVINCQGHLRLS